MVRNQKAVPKVVPGALICPQISVDKWSSLPGTVLYSFLSHAHSDHMTGLRPRQDRTIYCTQMTADIVKLILKDPESKIKYRIVETGNTYHLQCGSMFRPDGHVKVTVLEAFHCAGSAMFLFEAAFGRVLYTGDIRIQMDNPIYDLGTVKDDKLKGFEELLSGEPLDNVYLDNTYLNEETLFPSREEMTEEIMDLIQANQEKMIFIATYRIGKEMLFRKLAEGLGTSLLVDEERQKYAEASGYSAFTTTDPAVTRIEIINMRETAKEIRLFQQQNSTGQLLVVVPSALPGLHPDRFPWFKHYDKNPRVEIAALPYSDHSSHAELEKFLGHLKIRKMIPISKSMGIEEMKKYVMKETTESTETGSNQHNPNKREREDETSQLFHGPQARKWMNDPHRSAPLPRKRHSATGLPMTPSPDTKIRRIRSTDSLHIPPALQLSDTSKERTEENGVPSADDQMTPEFTEEAESRCLLDPKIIPETVSTQSSNDSEASKESEKYTTGILPGSMTPSPDPTTANTTRSEECTERKEVDRDVHSTAVVRQKFGNTKGAFDEEVSESLVTQSTSINKGGNSINEPKDQNYDLIIPERHPSSQELHRISSCKYTISLEDLHEWEDLSDYSDCESNDSNSKSIKYLENLNFKTSLASKIVQNKYNRSNKTFPFSKLERTDLPGSCTAERLDPESISRLPPIEVRTHNSTDETTMRNLDCDSNEIPSKLPSCDPSHYSPKKPFNEAIIAGRRNSTDTKPLDLLEGREGSLNRLETQGLCPSVRNYIGIIKNRKKLMNVLSRWKRVGNSVLPRKPRHEYAVWAKEAEILVIQEGENLA